LYNPSAALATLTETSEREYIRGTVPEEHMLNLLRLYFTACLSVLFFAVSFNAYACLLPITGTTPVPMANGCSTPDEQPVSPYCDTFKTLGVQSADNDQILCHANTVSLAQHVMLNSRSSRRADYSIVSSPQDLLLKISVLRL
jgi:hypothetical protein